MIVLAPQLADRIAHYAEAAYPEECVGWLLGQIDGTTKMVQAVVAVPNRSQDDRRRHFYLDPHDYLLVDRQARALGLDVVGCYHSHPDAPAQPSPYDRHGAAGAGPSFSFLIQAVWGGCAATLQAWWLPDLDADFVAEDLA
ncbi:M67 family metallopeptidase [Candidatus Oscillochloris fontis]|uniref:M67 family metallopeptidase n=1 Tax=Candidatus Oscillochloris fontis TaxID=2496868 RepID=UPI00101CDD56|nr:M67 family metallopeptidase [Candidatus Oscillochloris fontis]